MARTNRKKPTAAQLANPGERAKLAAKYLTPEQRQQRALNKALDAPAGPGSALTRRQVARMSNAAVEAQFADPTRLLNQYGRQIETRAAGIQPWFVQYREQIAKAQGVTQGRQEAQQAQLQQLGQSIPQIGAQQLAPINQAQQADAAARGAQVDPLLAVQAQQAQGQQAGYLAGAQALANERGQAQTDYGTKMQNATFAQEREVLGDVDRQRREHAEALLDLARKRGAAKTQATQDILDSEQKQRLEAAALGLDETKTKIAAYKAGGYDPITGEKLPEKPPSGYSPGGPGLNKYGYTYDEWAGMSSTAKAKARAGKAKTAKPTDPAKAYERDFFKKYGVKPASQEKVTQAGTYIGKAKTLLGQVTSLKKGDNITDDIKADMDYTGATRKQMAEAMLTKGAPEIWTTVALDLHFLKGYISKGTAAKLHNQGYSVKALNLKTYSPSGGEYKPTKGA